MKRLAGLQQELENNPLQLSLHKEWKSLPLTINA